MDQLLFEGLIVNGIGKHSELTVPGNSALSDAPSDWPERLCPGSLNLHVLEYPSAFAERGLSPSTKSLDMANFEPAFVIVRDAMRNNLLRERDGMPNRGDAQVWRASLSAEGRDIDCWVLRRFGSGLTSQIELVAGVGLRGELGLCRERDWPAKVALYGRWLE